MSPLDQAQDSEPTGRRFELIERIGKGAFGEVYLAMQLGTAGFSRKVALKVLNARSFGDLDAARRIRDEARVLGRLNHRHIVTVIDLVSLREQWALVMEFVDGADLEQILLALDRAGRVFPAAAAMEVVAAVADALDAGYNAEGPDGKALHVIHRDIKPANIRVTPNGAVKVLDFGIAHARMDNREARTGAYIIGTQRYMAPERIAGHPEKPSADVYSLAATAVEMMTGRPIGRSPVLADRHQEFIRQALVGLERSLRGEDDERARRIVGLMARCLDAEAINRPSAAEVAMQAARLGRQIETETLQEFCRRFVPQVQTLLGRQREFVTGVLTERTTGRRPADLGSPATLREQVEPSYSEEAEEAEPRRRGWLWPALAALGGAFAVVVLGSLLLAIATGLGATLVWVNLPGTPRISSQPAAAPEVEAEPVVVVEPAAPPPPPPEVVEPVVPEPVVAEPAVVRRRPAVVEDAPILSRAQVAVPGATGLRVTCGTVSASGTSSARIMKFPAGECDVSATVNGAAVHAMVEILEPRAVRCAVGAEGLACD